VRFNDDHSLHDVPPSQCYPPQDRDIGYYDGGGGRGGYRSYRWIQERRRHVIYSLSGDIVVAAGCVCVAGLLIKTSLLCGRGETGWGHPFPYNKARHEARAAKLRELGVRDELVRAAATMSMWVVCSMRSWTP
jgi:hypothetical protein